jgi:hypothetical protein
MPVTIPELLSDVPQFLALYSAAQAALAELPPAPAVRNAAMYAKAFGAADGSALAIVASLIDTIEAQAKS